MTFSSILDPRVHLLHRLIVREIAGRYRGSSLGLLWSLVLPLLMLAVYTFIFGSVLDSKWPSRDDRPQTAEFAIVLLSGLTIYQLFSDVVLRAPGLVLANANYVKKVVFPLELLVPVALGSALFHMGVTTCALMGFILFVQGYIPATVVMLPAVVVPLCLMILGIGWFLASLGAYYRDIGHILTPLMTALLFLSPIFYPISALPGWVRPWLLLNPVAWPSVEMRNVLIFGITPDAASFLIYTTMAVVVAVSGYLWFQATRKGFADVL